MPRSTDNIVPIEAPFGGLVSNGSPRLPGLRNARSLLNVHTANASIQVRPGWSNRGTVDNLATGAAASDFTHRLFAMDSDNIQQPMLIHVARKGAETWVNLLAMTGALLEINGATTKDQIKRTGTGAWGSIAPFPAKDIAFLPAIDLKIYYDDGVDDCWKYAKIGIDDPILTGMNIDVFSDPGSGLGGTGTYQYKVTWYNSITGTESGPVLVIDASNPNGEMTPPTDWSVRVEVPDPATDAQIDTMRVYRKGPGSGDQFWYLGSTTTKVAGKFRYDDDGSDTELRTPNGIPPIRNQRPPDANFAAAWKSRMWYLRNDERRVVWSETYQPEAVNPLNSLEVSTDGQFTGIFAAPGSLLIFQGDAIHAVLGDTPQSFVIQRIAKGPGIGPASDGTVKQLPDGSIVWVANAGVMRLQGQSLTNVSAAAVGPLQKIFRTGDLIYGDQYYTAAVDPQRRLYIINGMTAQNDFGKQLVYHYDTGAFSLWDLPISAICASPSRPDDNEIMLFGAKWEASSSDSDHNRLIALDADDDNGTPISWHWRTGLLDFGLSRLKHIRFLTVAFYGEGSTSQTFDLKVGTGGSLTALSQTTDNDSALSKLFRVSRRAKQFQFELSGTADKPLYIDRLEIDGMMADRR